MSWQDEPITWPQMIKLNELLKCRFVPDTLKFNNALKKVVKTKGEASKLIEKLSKEEKVFTLTEEEIAEVIKEAMR